MKLLKIAIFGLVTILISKFAHSEFYQWYPIIIKNNQDIPTPPNFQQQIAICNGDPGLPSNFAYINNATLFNEINPNGQNVYFTTTYKGAPDIYSWYEGQLNYNGVTCYVWWIKLPYVIAKDVNNNVTIYMYIGHIMEDNFYWGTQGIVGASPNVFPSRQHDNGRLVFVVYGYFNNTFDGWTGYIFNGSFSPTATSNGIQMLNGQAWQGTYILPPNNWNVANWPLIVETAWYYTHGADANVIALYGDTGQQLRADNIGSTAGGSTSVPRLSTFVQFQYWQGDSPPTSQAAMLKSALTNQYLNYTYFPPNGGTIYSYLIVDSSYAQAGYYYYSSNQVWVPLTLLNTYNINYHRYTYANLDYYPFQYRTLQISAGSGANASYQYIQWVVARSYPPNGVMPSISIGPSVPISIQLDPSSSPTVCPGTQTSSTVTVNLDNPNGISTSVILSCSAPYGITCSLYPSSCTTRDYCIVALYVSSDPTTPPGSYSITVTASTFNSSASATYTYNVGQCAASISSIQINPSSSPTVCPGTQTSSTVTVNLDNPSAVSTSVTFSCSAPSGITCSLYPSSCTTSGSSCSTTLYVNSSPTTPLGSYRVTVTASTSGSSASATYTYNIGQQISILSQQSSNFQNSYNIYITGCAQNYTLYVNNSPYCYDSYSQFQNINALCVVSYPGSYSVYARGCYNGTCVNSNTINLNIPSSGITVPIISINVLNITNQNIYVTISVNGSNQNIQSINVYYNNNNVYSNSNVNTNYYSFNLQLPYSNNGNITVCSTLTNGQSGCVTQIFSVNAVQTIIYYGIIQLQAKVQPININTTYGPIGNRFEFSIDQPEYILTLNITNIGNITLNNITINLQQLGNVPEMLYNRIPIRLLNNINIDQLQPNQSYILQFSVLPLYPGSSSLLLNFNVNGQNIGNAQYNLIVKGSSNKFSLVVSESINYILMLLGIIVLILFLI